MLILLILMVCGVLVLGLIFLQINQISRAIMTVSHQLVWIPMKVIGVPG